MNGLGGKINSIFLPKFILGLIILLIGCGAALGDETMKLAEHPEVSHQSSEEPGNPFLYPIKFYRDYISSADADRCPMHPTCSQYCMEAFKKHGPLLGWIMCSDRLMRCGRDETKLSAPVLVNGKKRIYDPVSNNDFWWH